MLRHESVADGVKTIVALDHDGNLHTGTEQDATPYLERAKAMSNEGMFGSSDLRLAASVPFAVVEKYCNDKGITFREFSQNEFHKVAFLNNPDYSSLRIWKGRV